MVKMKPSKKLIERTSKVAKNKRNPLKSLKSKESLKSKAQKVSKVLLSANTAKHAVTDSEEEYDEFTMKSNVNDDSDPDTEGEDEAEKHKRDLEKLKQSDPEFYKFLQENDKKLLQFNLSDEELDYEDNLDEVHKPAKNLEVASDESDFEPDDDTPKDNRIITLKLLKTWQMDIQTDKSNKTITALIQAFHAALKNVTSDGDEEPTVYIVEGSAIFNGVIQLCVLELGPAIRRFLGLHRSSSKQPPHKCKKFVKIKNILKTYFGDILKLLIGVTSSNIQTVLLKHLHYLSNLLVSFQNITKSLVKKLVSLWGTAEDSIRVLAFFCILRITHNQQATILDSVLKSMYMTYVKNTKFVSFKSLPAINFMRRSLVEMYALDTSICYSHVFLYIRQLAIHLRNAITINKKENIQAVYNWQFLNSIRLWGSLLSLTYNESMMHQLVYPLVQVCIGTIKLVSTAQYYPLRFHIVQVLIDLSKETGVFIPILPFLLEILNTYDFNKRHQNVSMKPIHFYCLLRLSKSQLQENGFKDSVIETIYRQILEYLASNSHTIAFPDLALICELQIKNFLKKCRNPNYTKKMKQILEKIQQNSIFIEKERGKMTLKITDFKQIEAWETQICNNGTPLNKYFESWNKLHTIKKNKQLTNNEELGDYKLPTIKRVKKTQSKAEDGPVELFPSDSEDEVDGQSLKRKRGKRGGKNVNKKVVDESGPVDDSGEKDIIEDIELGDW